MGIILWIIFGGLVGWVASLIMKTDAQQGIVLNIVVGIVGVIVGMEVPLQQLLHCVRQAM
jgi:uncharacterized membrane protein YeaQ/YmgE (transglycosylase-associated protein family)